MRRILAVFVSTAKARGAKARGDGAKPWPEPTIGRWSKLIWPWRDEWLIPLVALMAALDHISTYLLLEFAGTDRFYESGLLAAWALKRGGFNGLYIMDAVAVGLLCVIAVTARLYYHRFGLNGLARTAYVAVLVPYAIAAQAAVINNLLLLFLAR
ncbi:MAG: hypothetical protein QF467_02100 [SAR202 cluster bacterium]|nr:hypothetical protein [SAR202 cluster bacterium]